MITVNQLKEKAVKLSNSKFNNGEPVLFCVDYGFYLGTTIHSRLFSTAEKAIAFLGSLYEKDYKNVYPVFDIWGNPNQVD